MFLLRVAGLRLYQSVTASTRSLSCRALEKKQENGETIELSAEGRPELVEEKELPVVDCTCFGLPRRYIIAILSGFGFCISFGIRCNLGVAIVSMVNSHTVFRDNKEVIVVSGVRDPEGRGVTSAHSEHLEPEETPLLSYFCLLLANDFAPLLREVFSNSYTRFW